MRSILSEVLAHEQLHYFAGLEPKCAEAPNREATSADPVPECVLKSLQACFAGRFAPRAPLVRVLRLGPRDRNIGLPLGPAHRTAVGP
jgi:hypothetical protein